MAKMTDPTQAMESLQEALLAGEIHLLPGRLDPNLFVFADSIEDKPRFTYVRLEGSQVTAFANFIVTEPLDDSPCFALGYAVPEKFRKQGFATGLVQAAIAELKNGFTGYPPFAVEAVIGETNLASQKVADRALTNQRKKITDQESGLPAFQYVQKFQTGPAT